MTQASGVIARLERLGLPSRLEKLLPILATLGVGLTLSVVAFLLVRDFEGDRLRSQFERRGADLEATVVHTIDDHLESTYSIASLYGSTDAVDRAEFSEFVSRSLAVQPGIQALEWIPRVPDSQRASYEADARADGFADFQITERNAEGEAVPAAQRAEYFPVYYVEPYAGNEAALGFDLGSNPARLEALNRATDTGDATATARITLVQETASQAGFLVFVPIFAVGLPHETLDERQENLTGFALAVLRVGDMLEDDLARLDTSGLDLQLIDTTNPADQALLYSQTPGVEQSATSDWSTDLPVADRTWTLALSSRSDLTGFSSWLPWAVLIVGLLATGLLARYLLAIRGHADDVEKSVTERTAQLDDANRELTRSNQELEDFTYVVSHDLKEPLRGIEAFSSFLAEDYSEKLDDEGKRLVTVVRESAVRMKVLIEDLLELSRIGRVGAKYTTVAIEPLIGEVTDDLQFSIEEKRVNLRVAPDLPDVICDRARIKEVFANLISNAIKFNDKPEPLVEIACHQNNGAYTFSVADDGIGIAQEYHEKVFGIFQRLNRREEYDGTGAGLTICKKIVEAHGGEMRVESRVGHGCTFSFTIPTSLLVTEKEGAGS